MKFLCNFAQKYAVYLVVKKTVYFKNITFVNFALGKNLILKKVHSNHRQIQIIKI